MAWYDNITVPSLLGIQEPSYLETVFPEQAQAWRDKANRNAAVGALTAYLKAPKNQNRGYGALIGDILGGAQAGGQGTYNTELANYMTGKKIAGMQKEEVQNKALEDAVKQSGGKYSADIANKLIQSNNFDAAQKYANLFKTQKEILGEKATYSPLSAAQATALGLDTSRGQKYQRSPTGEINLIGGQIAPTENIKIPREVGKGDIAITNQILEGKGIKGADDLSGVISAEANKIVASEGLSYPEAVNKALNTYQSKGAIENWKRVIPTPFGDWTIPYTQSKKINPEAIYNAPAAPATKADVEAKKQPISEAEYNKLPKGASYVAPDGKTYIKR